MNWKYGLLTNVVELFDVEKRIGRILPTFWKMGYNCKLNDKRFLFEKRGFFDPILVISSPNSNFKDGKIEFFGAFRNTATIELRDGNIYYWKFENFWHTKWSIEDERGQSIQYIQKFYSGEIISNIDDELLILAGLVIKFIRLSK